MHSRSMNTVLDVCFRIAWRILVTNMLSDRWNAACFWPGNKQRLTTRRVSIWSYQLPTFCLLKTQNSGKRDCRWRSTSQGSSRQFRKRISRNLSMHWLIVRNALSMLKRYIVKYLEWNEHIYNKFIIIYEHIYNIYNECLSWCQSWCFSNILCVIHA